MDRREFFLRLAAALAGSGIAGKCDAAAGRIAQNGDAADWMPYIFWTKSQSGKLTLPVDFAIHSIQVRLPDEMLYAEVIRLLESTEVEFLINQRALLRGRLAGYCGMSAVSFSAPIIARAGASLEINSTEPGPILILSGLLKTV